MLRQPLLMLARSHKAKELVATLPVSSGIVSGYVPGETTADAVRASRTLIQSGLHVTLDFLGEDTLDREQADHTVAAYLDVRGTGDSGGNFAIRAQRIVRPPQVRHRKGPRIRRGHCFAGMASQGPGHRGSDKADPSPQRA